MQLTMKHFIVHLLYDVIMHNLLLVVHCISFKKTGFP